MKKILNDINLWYTVEIDNRIYAGFYAFDNRSKKEIIIDSNLKEQNIKLDKLDYIIKLYSQSCSRIVKTLSGALLVELYDKTLYFNASGINEFE